MRKMTTKDAIARMLELFPGVRVQDLTKLVDANVERRVTRGSVESALMGMVDVCEDDDGGLWMVGDATGKEKNE
jgi:hypothetical protein